jgi:lysophospholipase L1-like esterase
MNVRITAALLLAAFTALATAIAPPAVAADAAASEAPAVGVATDPCMGVPVQPTAAHKAAKDTYDAWMHDWLLLDWGQRCRYRAENAALPPATAQRVVLIGDSITEGWKEQHAGWFGPQRVDRGISGQVSEQMLVRMRSDVLDLKPAVVHIMAGTNDVAGNRGPTTIALIEGNIATMAELARAHGIRVVLASVPPAAGFPWQPGLRPAGDIRTINAWLRDYARREHYTWVDYGAVLDDGAGGLKKEYSGDGVHPNAAGYAVMEPLFESAVSKALAGRR